MKVRLFPHFHKILNSPLPIKTLFCKVLNTKIVVSDREYTPAVDLSRKNTIKYSREKKLSFFYNSFLPKAELFFEKTENGTAIHFFSELMPSVKIFLLIYLILTLVMQTGLFIQYFGVYHYFPGIQLFMPVFLSAAAYLMAFAGLAVSTRNFLLQLEELTDRKSE